MSLVAIAPKNNTEIRYNTVVVRVAANVPTGIDRCVSFSEADLLEPAIIPVTAGKNKPTNALKQTKKENEVTKSMRRILCQSYFSENA